MRTTLSVLTLAAIPLTALALTIQPGNLFTDVRESNPEAAGINMLSREGIVQGYGNGFFGATRAINRAEFLKIAMKSASADTTFPAADCFPDVHASDWFSPFVCGAKDRGIVSGKADSGLFAPALPVTYGEALKMLDLLFGYDVPDVAAPHWAEGYYLAAADRTVDLPVRIDLDTPLTRGLAARLAAAFLAESEGQLQQLRLAEAGEYSYASSRSSSSSSQQSSASSSSSSLSSSSSSQAPTPTLFSAPSVSHFLIAGQMSDPIADLVVRSNGETARITSAQLKLFAEVPSVDTFDVVTAEGVTVAILRQRTTTDVSDYKMIYEVQVDAPNQVAIPADTNVPLFLRAKIRGVNNNGASEQLLQVRTFSVTIHGNTTQVTTNIPGQSPFPKHQTSFGRITRVERTSPATGVLASATGMVINAFSVSGTVLPGKSLSLEQLTFTIEKSGTFTVSSWRIGQLGSLTTAPCTLEQTMTTLTCPNIQMIGALPASLPLTLELKADVTVPAGTTGLVLEADLKDTGSPSDLGSLQWTDQSGHFRWIEGVSPVEKGTRYVK